MAFLRSPYIKFSAIDTNGLPLIGGKVYTYIAGTNTPTDTWSDFGVTLNSNPIILNSMGQANIFLTENLAYKYVVKDAFDNTIETQDNIISSLGGDDISSCIFKDGTSTTTAQIPFAEGLSSAKGLRIIDGLYGPASPQIFLGDDTLVYIFRTPDNSFYIQNSDLYNPFSIYNHNVSTDSSVAGFGFSNTGIEVMQGGAVVPSYIKYKLYNPNAGGFNGHIFEGAGMSITAPFADGSAIKIPDGSWIRPQTPQGGMYLTNGEDPTDLNSILKLTTGETVLTNGDGVIKNGLVSIGDYGVNIVHNEDGSSNSTISLSDTNVTIYSGDNSNLALSASSATMYGGDSNLTLNSTYASLYQAGSGFYIDATGIKPQGVAAGTITANGNLGLDSNGYIVKSTNPTESNRTVSSGLYNDGDGILSIGTGGAGVATTFSISNGSGFIENNGVVTTVTWTGKTNIAVTNIATQNITYISIDLNGNVIQQATRWSPTEFSNNIVLGVVVHVNRVNVDAVNNEQSVMANASTQVGDVLEGIGFVNIDGNIFGPNGATLGLTKTAGLVMNRGINWASGGHKNPHKLILPVLSPVTALQYRMRDGSSSALNLTVVNPNIYDDGSAYGSAPAVPTNKFTVQRIYAFTSNNVKIQPGQAVYNSLAEAKANIQLEPFITEPSIASNGILRGFLCIQQGTTSLTNASKVFFISAGKFGGSTGVGGLSVSTLQNTYDNSTNPEILTNTSLGSVSIKRGSASDTDAVLEVLNGAGTTTARINGDGSAVLSGTLTGTSASFSGNVSLSSNVSDVGIYSTSSQYLVGGSFVGRSNRGSIASPTASQNGDGLLWLGGRGYGATGYASSSKGVLKVVASENWTDAAQGTDFIFQTTLNGGTTRADALKIGNDKQITFYGALTGTSATFSGLVTAATVPTADTSLTNKLYVDQLVQKVTTAASTATLTVDSATTTQASLTAQAVALTIAPPTGGVDGRKLTIRIKDNGTARAITWNGIFRAVGVTLPATTVVSKILYVGAIYNSNETKWDVVSVAQEV